MTSSLHLLFLISEGQTWEADLCLWHVNDLQFAQKNGRLNRQLSTTRFLVGSFTVHSFWSCAHMPKMYEDLCIQGGRIGSEMEIRVLFHLLSPSVRCSYRCLGILRHKDGVLLDDIYKTQLNWGKVGNFPVWISGNNEFYSETSSANLLEELHFCFRSARPVFCFSFLWEEKTNLFLSNLSLLKDLRVCGKK